MANNMHAILVSVSQPPEKQAHELESWGQFVLHTETLRAQTRKGEWLGPGCLLLPDRDGMAVLAAVICEAEKRHLSYKVLLMEGVTVWGP